MGTQSLAQSDGWGTFTIKQKVIKGRNFINGICKEGEIKVTGSEKHIENLRKGG